MGFEFATAGQILFGSGSFERLGGLASRFGCRALIITGRQGRFDPAIRDRLEAAGVQSSFFSVSGEPTVETVSRGVEAGRGFGADLVASIGGGSVLDAGKAIAALLTNPGEPLDYLEVIGRGKAWSRPSLPYIAVPTTAGTGTEVTRNAVLTSPEHGVKASLRGPWLLPAVALVDPELTYDLPPDITAASGMDALAQVIEPMVSAKAQPLTDALCREALPRAARSLRRVFEDGRDKKAREDICFLSLCGGLALANAGLGAIHGLAAPLGGMFAAPHGALCACLLPGVVRANLSALAGRDPSSTALSRYREIAALLTGSTAAAPEAAVQWLLETRSRLQIPGLARYGMRPEHIPAVVEKAQATSSMKGNPVRLSAEELAAVLEEALHP